MKKEMIDEVKKKWEEAKREMLKKMKMEAIKQAKSLLNKQGASQSLRISRETH